MSNGTPVHGLSVRRRSFRRWALLSLLVAIVAYEGPRAVLGIRVVLNALEKSTVDPTPFVTVLARCGDDDVRLTGHKEVRPGPSGGPDRVLYRLQRRHHPNPDFETVFEEWLDERLFDEESRLQSAPGACWFFTPHTLVIGRPNGTWIATTRRALLSLHTGGDETRDLYIASCCLDGNGSGVVALASEPGRRMEFRTSDFGVTWRRAE